MYREQWLNEGLILLTKEVFKPAKYTPPKDIRISCGFPSSGAFNSRRQTIGQCWYPEASDGHQLFISPTLDCPLRILDVTVHEVVHTIAGSQAKHGKQFKHVALRVGLAGAMTATVAGPILKPRLEAIAKQLGPYPHKAISGKQKLKGPPRPKALPCECLCGYAAKVPSEWVELAGYPVCPACKLPMLPPSRS